MRFDGQLFDRTFEFVPTARYEADALPERAFSVRSQASSGLVDAAITDEHLPREQQRLCSGSGRCETSFDQEQISAAFFRHPSRHFSTKLAVCALAEQHARVLPSERSSTAS